MTYVREETLSEGYFPINTSILTVLIGYVHSYIQTMYSTSMSTAASYLKVAKLDSRRWVIKLPLSGEQFHFSAPAAARPRKRVEKTHYT